MRLNYIYLCIDLIIFTSCKRQVQHHTLHSGQHSIRTRIFFIEMTISLTFVQSEAARLLSGLWRCYPWCKAGRRLRSISLPYGDFNDLCRCSFQNIDILETTRDLLFLNCIYPCYSYAFMIVAVLLRIAICRNCVS